MEKDKSYRKQGDHNDARKIIKEISLSFKSRFENGYNFIFCQNVILSLLLLRTSLLI